MSIFTFKEVILREKEQLRQRRKKLDQEHGTPEQENWFGIAMSGAGDEAFPWTLFAFYVAFVGAFALGRRLQTSG